MAIISGSKVAASPEALMRSRYSAYKLQNVDYIYKTYASEAKLQQSIEDISSWAKQTTWLKLNILETSHFPELTASSATSLANTDAFVTFEADYIFDNKLWRMKEKSRFIIENNQWRYIDGEFSHGDGQKLPSRNENCPCGSKKKFKRCCGKS